MRRWFYALTVTLTLALALLPRPMAASPVDGYYWCGDSVWAIYYADQQYQACDGYYRQLMSVWGDGFVDEAEIKQECGYDAYRDYCIMVANVPCMW